MPTVETTVWVDAPLDRVYTIAKDVRSYPEYMKDVKSLTVVEDEGNRVVSDYVGIVPNFMIKVRWRQEDVWDDAQKMSRFRQVQGDYDRLEGSWKFREENGGTRFDSVLDYEYTVPTLGPLVKKVIHGIVQKNLENILQAIKERAESHADA